MRIRKQVYELTLSDLDQSPVWEFALDEEGEEGQDEATVRPFRAVAPLDPSAGMFVVRASFRLADQSLMRGYLTPPVHADSSFGTTQPVIVTDTGQVPFWYGALAPTPEAVHQTYVALGRTASQVFPISYSADIEVLGGKAHGQIGGFGHYRSLQDRRVVLVR